MNADNNTQNNISVFVLGAMLNLMAVIDWTSLVDYILKALVGGLIWLVFKVVGDVVMDNIREDKKRKDEQKESDKKDGNQLRHE